MFKSHSARSHTWSCIMSGAKVMRSGLGRVIYNGRNSKFWLDVWVGDTSLISISIAMVPASMRSRSVASYWRKEGGWNWAEFSHLIPVEWSLKLASIVLFVEEQAEDSWVWRKTASGCFSVASAYSLVRQELSTYSESQLSVWHLCWKINVPERIRYFLWCLSHNGILSNAKRFERHLSAYDTCLICNYRETSLHILRDCPEVRLIWKALVPSVWHSCFFQANLLNWLQMNLESSFVWKDISWPSFFATLIWWFWKMRCKIFYYSSILLLFNFATDTLV
ncbi:hypothetical protein M5689_021163 [Euphorbia peplus]|nr:hypothetical protein M5689_021163 [Euphorbia peplus]